MAQQRTIVGIGEAIMLETPQGRQPSGLAVIVARDAARLGQTGVVVSRLGQDETAEEILRTLGAGGVATEHIQSDPDLATGRLIIRAIGGPAGREQREAFDNLQWDFDLTDLAQRTDVAVFGLLATRSSQTRSVVQQYLAECGSALRLVDLTNRESDEIDRTVAVAMLEAADIALVDSVALQEVVPAVHDESGSVLARQHDLSLVLQVTHNDSTVSLTAWSGRERWDASQEIPAPQISTAIVAFMHAATTGLDVEASLACAVRVADWTGSNAGEPVPAAVLMA